MKGIPLSSVHFLIDEMRGQAILISLPDLRIVHANPLYLATNRISLEKARGLCCREVSYHRDTPCAGPEHTCPVTTTLNTKDPSSAVHTHFDANGNGQMARLRSVPVLDDDGNVAGVVEITRFADELHLIHEDLKRKSGFLEDLIRTSPEGTEEAVSAVPSGTRSRKMCS